ncbi:NAD-dependent epimerase/dehydratase family protein [Actinacidiphila yeochonensis]|uniref:NAD-dependent epimerase/dehydratase family protein n=1 Tax=Actinacidiphila yeochonensis TaxID=89050 RepID=UPI00055A59DD|nr:NAD-dependent epimerase/dehydratase family protein [Actinacidiphila yeochonensis]
MRVLVLGGTEFVGRAIVADALASGAEVTLFNRGRTGRDLFPEARRLVGDRDTGDYTALRGGAWDAVVDVSGYLRRQVRQAADVLEGAVGRYLFVSSHAVYVRVGVAPGSDEDTPLRPPVVDPPVLDEDTYGPSKVACEQEVRERFGERATVVRPGKVVGPHDPEDTLAYWVRRAARGGRVALPGDPRQPVQVVDSRDLARLVVRLVEDGRAGAFHAVGPERPVTLGGLVETCARVAGTQVELVPVPVDAVSRSFPLVRPYWAGQQRSAARARAAGMPSTPLEATVADVLAWDRERGEPPLRSGASDEEERALLGCHGERRPTP